MGRNETGYGWDYHFPGHYYTYYKRYYTEYTVYKYIKYIVLYMQLSYV